MRLYDGSRQRADNRYVSTRKAGEESAAIGGILHDTTSLTVAPTPINAVLEQTKDKAASLPPPAVLSIAPEVVATGQAASPAVVDSLQPSAQD